MNIWAQVFESGEVHEKLDLQRPFMSAVCASLAGSPWTFPSRRKIEFWIVSDAFPAVLRGCHTLFSLFLVDLLSLFLIPPHPTLPVTISMQIWMNYETHVF